MRRSRFLQSTLLAGVAGELALTGASREPLHPAPAPHRTATPSPTSKPTAAPSDAPMFLRYDAPNRRFLAPVTAGDAEMIQQEKNELLSAAPAALSVAPLYFHASERTFGNAKNESRFRMRVEQISPFGSDNATVRMASLGWSAVFMVIDPPAGERELVRSKSFSGIGVSELRGIPLVDGKAALVIDLTSVLYNTAWNAQSLGAMLRAAGITRELAASLPGMIVAAAPLAALEVAEAAFNVVNAALAAHACEYFFTKNFAMQIAITTDADNADAAETLRIPQDTVTYYAVVQQSRSTDFLQLVGQTGKVTISNGVISAPDFEKNHLEDHDYFVFSASSHALAANLVTPPASLAPPHAPSSPR